MVRKGLAHLGLVAEALTKPEDPLWLPTESRLRGPPEELFPADLDDAGLPVEVDGGDEGQGEAYLDELRVGDWAGWLGGATACWVAQRRAERLELT